MNFFSELGQVSVAWSKTSSQPTGSVNNTPTNTARTELHSMMSFHHANTRGSRAGRLRIAHLCVPETICHPRVMSHSLPHLTLTTRTSSLSPISSTSPIFPTVSPTRCSMAERRINTNPISHKMPLFHFCGSLKLFIFSFVASNCRRPFDKIKVFSFLTWD